MNKKETYFAIHNHSYYSFQDGYSSPKEYLDRATELGLKGFAITEHGNQCSWIYFDEIKKNYPNIKMVYGIEFYLCDNVNVQDNDNRYYHLVALAKDKEGRKILNRLQRLSKDNFYYKPRVDLEMFKQEDCSHLIVSGACLASKISKYKNNIPYCVELVKEYKNVFPNFYLEMQSHHSKEQELYNQVILTLSITTNTPYVITTDSHYALKEDEIYQARHVQIAHDNETLSEIYEGCYLQSVNEIHDCMDGQIGYKNVEKGLQETLNILDTIDEVNMPWQDAKLPHFNIPKEFNNEKEYISYLVKDVGWKKRYLDKKTIKEQKIYRDRLEYELSTIDELGFNGYFLIVWDIIEWCRSTKLVEVGDGRGSGAGSLVNYLLGITGLDPIKYEFVFERFLNPERISYPDIDFDVSNRDIVIKHLQELYGYDRVAQVCNYSYITPVVAIKDSATVLGLPYFLSEKISKNFTAKTWKECIELNPNVLEEYAEYKELFDIASHLSGRVRHSSIHAGGVVIGDSSLDNYIGIIKGSNNENVICLDKKKCQPIGLVKHDILGLSNLSIIKEVKNDLNLSDWEIDPNNEEFINNKDSFDLICSGKTNALFQMESLGMKDLILKCQPRNLSELGDVNALFRPDAMGMQNEYVLCKTGQQKPVYWHKDIEEILSYTYGSLIYQEQTMAIVRKFGNRTMGGADIFRKYISSKDTEKIKKESKLLYDEIINNGYEQELAMTISEYLSQMGGYGFNKPHAYEYAVITIQTAYLKFYYPLYFFKALLNQNKNDFGNINKYIMDAKDFNIIVQQPHINKSERDFSIANDKILFGLEAIKGIGKKIVDSILLERNNGDFKNIKDLLERVNLNISQMVALIKSGALPCKNKKLALLQYANMIINKSEYKPVTTFTLSLEKAKTKYGFDFKPLSKEEKLIKLNEYKKNEFDIKSEIEYNNKINEFKTKYMQEEKFWEFDTLSIFLHENPFVQAYEYLTPLDEIIDGNNVTLIGVISNIVKKKDRNKNDYGFINLYSLNGLLELTCWSSQFKRFIDLIKKGQQIAVKCKKQNENSLVVQEIKSYDKWLSDMNLKHLK